MRITRVGWNFHWLSLGLWCFTGSVRTEGGRYELTSSCGFQEAVVLRLSDYYCRSEIPNKQLRLVVEISLFTRVSYIPGGCLGFQATVYHSGRNGRNKVFMLVVMAR